MVVLSIPKLRTEMLEIRDPFWTVHELLVWLVLYLCVKLWFWVL